MHSRSCPPEFFILYRSDDPIQDRSTKNRPVFGLSSSFGEPHLKSGNVSETCRRHGIAPNPFYRWNDEAEQVAKAALGDKSAAAAETGELESVPSAPPTIRLLGPNLSS